jgi:drug/metabolite transporter (DMT)-like permease
VRSRGVFYIAISALGFSAMSVLVKVCSETLPTGEIVLARAVATLGLSYALVKRAGLSPWGLERKRLVLRGALGFAALACYYGALARLPLADATVLQNTIPVFTALLAWWLLGERVGWGAAIAIGCGLGGVMLVMHPGGDSGDAVGAALAIGGAMLSATAYVTVRKLARTEDPLVIVFYFPLVAAPLALPWALSEWQWPSAREWVLLAAIGVTTQIGQVFLTLGLAVEKAARATAAGYLQICFAIGWQLLVFGKQPTLATIAGAALIIAGTLAVEATAAKRATVRGGPHPRTPT